VLEPQPRLALLGGLLIAAFALAAPGIGHGMAFVEHEDAVEVFSEPIDDLLDS